MGFDPGQVRSPVLFMHGGQDQVAPSSHAKWLARHTPSAELWLRPDDGHISVLNSAATALAWLRSTRTRADHLCPGQHNPLQFRCSAVA